MQKLLVLLSLMLISNATFSQTKDTLKHQDAVVIDTNKAVRIRPFDVRLPVVKAIRTTALLDSLVNVPQDEVFLISVAVAFNDNGVVDTVYFSDNLRARLKSFFKPADKMQAGIIKNLSGVKTYKNTVILFPVLFSNDRHMKMNKLSFLEDFKNLWPTLSPRDQTRKLIILEPYHQWVLAHHQ